MLFIVNPISGGKEKKFLPKLLDRYFDTRRFEASMVYTQHEGHAGQLAFEATANGAEIIVAAGGDGTVNEVAGAIKNTPSCLGIIPYGSGNGLARHLKIPMDRRKALACLCAAKIDCIDSATLNNEHFFNMAGVGFDAHISLCFASRKTRGFMGYIETSIKELRHYKPMNYELEIDGKIYLRKAFMICFANSTQFGNNAHIAPQADIKDGMLDVCIVKPFPLYVFPILAFRMLAKTAHLSKYVEIIKAKHVILRRNHPGAVHLDGEPRVMGKELHINVDPLSLNVIIGA